MANEPKLVGTMRIHSYQRMFLDAHDSGNPIRLFYPRIKSVMVTYQEAQAMLKTGKWIKPEGEK
jgi:hypothetical protein